MESVDLVRSLKQQQKVLTKTWSLRRKATQKKLLFQLFQMINILPYVICSLSKL